MFPVITLIGPRQCGKSTLVRQLHPDWKYYDLESPDDYQLITDDPVSFFSINSGRVIIDEAQQYPELFKVLRGVIDSDRSTKGGFLLTGSSSPDIVKGITESLAGRNATVEMAPFKGGFPEPLIESEKNEDFHRHWMDNYLADYVSRDIRGLFPRLNIHHFKRFLSLLAQYSGHQMNYEFHGKGAAGLTVSTV